MQWIINGIKCKLNNARIIRHFNVLLLLIESTDCDLFSDTNSRCRLTINDYAQAGSCFADLPVAGSTSGTKDVKVCTIRTNKNVGFA